MNNNKKHEVDVFALLQTLETLPCLWFKQHPDYKDRTKRDTAEQYLIEYFNFPNVTMLRNKIRSIRNTYNQEVAKIKSSKTTGSASASIHKPKLVWFEEADKFLSKNVGQSPHQEDTLNDELGESSTNTSTSVPIDSVNNFDILDDEEKEEQLRNPHYNDDQDVEVIQVQPSDVKEREPPKKRSKYDPAAATKQLIKTVEVLEKVSERRAAVAANAKPKNEFVAFGETLGLQLQTLSQRRAVETMAQISNIMTAKRLLEMAEQEEKEKEKQKKK